jgi:hypothetical protein
MSRTNRTLALCVLAVALTSGTVAAQQTSPLKPAAKVEQKAEPSTLDQSKETWDQTKEMTRKEWGVAKKKWAQEKAKWSDCNRQSRKEKLEAPKSWSFIASCMTKT